MAARKNPASFMTRDATGKPTITPDGLGLVVKLARLGRPKSYIASRLSITKGEFNVLLGKANDPNPVRMAYEEGFSEHEAQYRRILLRHAEKNAIPAIFYGKSVFGMVDTPKPEPSVENKIQITLPAPMTTEQYFKTLGISAPLDFRTARGRAEAEQRLLENAAHDAGDDNGA